MTKPNPEKHYRPCVGIALFNDDGRLFVGERIDNPGAWQMPQGGIDADETIEQAAFRELHEEIGTNKAQIIRIAEEHLRYDLPENLAQKLWNGRYVGQEQIWVAMRFLGDDQDINLDHDDKPEFQQWQWIAMNDCLDLIVPFKRDVYKNVIRLFEDIPQTL